MSLADDVNSTLQGREEEKERSDKLRLMLEQKLQRKSGILFQDMARDADKTVTTATARKGCEHVTFKTLNVFMFEVGNPVYPAIWVTVHHLGDCIRFTRKTIQDERSDAVTDTDQIDIALEGEHLRLSHRGQRLQGKDHALHVMPDPVFRI